MKQLKHIMVRREYRPEKTALTPVWGKKRTKDALLAAKARGVVLGKPSLSCIARMGTTGTTATGHCSVQPQQLRQLGDIRRDPPRLIFCEQLGRRFAGTGSVHGVKQEQNYNDGTQNNHPIGNLSATYRCFPLEPFHDPHPRLGCASVG